MNYFYAIEDTRDGELSQRSHDLPGVTSELTEAATRFKNEGADVTEVTGQIESTKHKAYQIDNGREVFFLRVVEWGDEG